MIVKYDHFWILLLVRNFYRVYRTFNMAGPSTRLGRIQGKFQERIFQWVEFNDFECHVTCYIYTTAQKYVNICLCLIECNLLLI